jgi:Acetyl-CoA acetyltransferase
MSKTTQENPAVESPTTETVSNTSKSTPRSAKSTGTATTSTSDAAKTSRPRRASTRTKTPASNPKTASKSTTQTSVQQDNTMSQNTVRRVAIIGGNRIPFARSNGAYFTASNSDMFTAALNGLVERFNLQGQRLGEVVAGAVLKHSRDFNMTRECVLNTELAPETPAYDIQQACGTGLQAAFLVANKIALGQIEVGVAGGVDTTSDAPIAFGDGLRKALLELNIAKTGKDRLKALTKINVKDLMDAPKNGEPRTGLSMGDHQAITRLNGVSLVKRKMNLLHLRIKKWQLHMKKVSSMT